MLPPSRLVRRSDLDDRLCSFSSRDSIPSSLEGLGKSVDGGGTNFIVERLMRLLLPLLLPLTLLFPIMFRMSLMSPWSLSNKYTSCWVSCRRHYVLIIFFWRRVTETRKETRYLHTTPTLSKTKHPCCA